MPGTDCAAGGLQLHALGKGPNALERGRERYLAARLLEIGGVGLGYLLVIDDAGLGGVKGGDASGIGFKLVEFVGADASEAGDTVGRASAVELLKGWNFSLINGDDNLAALFVGDAAFVAEPREESGAFYAVAGLQEPGR